MLVIGDPELLIRVNVGPTTNGAARENYGTFYDFSAIPEGATRPSPPAFEFYNMKFPDVGEPCKRHG
jgi:hypothetical protein